jgi:hypothetical protein
MSEDIQPVNHNFLYFAQETTARMDPAIRAVVRKIAEIGNVHEVCQYYEITNEPLLRDLLNNTVAAANMKMNQDVEQHVVGNTSLNNVISHAVVLALLMGAHLAKEKKL